MDNRDIVFKLIQNAFKNEILYFESNDEKELSKMIYENGLIGLVFHVIDKNSFKEKAHYQKLKQVFDFFVSKDIQQQFIIDQLKALFNEHKIKHIFLKGVHLKKLYPEVYMRGMGDIDILVPKTEFSDALQLLYGLDFKLIGTTVNHHELETPDKNTIELHQSIVSIAEYDSSDFLSKVWQHVKIENNELSLELEFEYAYLLSHLARHLKTSGNGIRSFLDIWIFSNAYDKVMDMKKVEIFLEDSKLIEFNNKVKKINDIFLGNTKSSDEDYDAITYIIKSGIHGKGTEHDSYIPRRAYESSVKKKSKLKYFFGEIFPNKERIQEAYPYLKKHPWLLPWAWVVRIFKQIFKKPKDTKKRLQAITSDKNTDEVTGIYKYFGL